MPASLSRRLKRQQDRDTNKLTDKIRKETLEKLNKLTDAQKKGWIEHNDFILAHDGKLSYDLTHLPITIVE